MIDGTKILNEFACRCAEDALKKANVTDERCWNAIKVKRDWLKGKATDNELAAAQASARDAARDAARAAARDAAWAAERAAAWDAAQASAWDAARDAAWAAERAAERDAAQAAARDEQNILLEKMVYEL